jgi:hypothetical protein
MGCSPLLRHGKVTTKATKATLTLIPAVSFKATGCAGHVQQVALQGAVLHRPSITHSTAQHSTAWRWAQNSGLNLQTTGALLQIKLAALR